MKVQSAYKNFFLFLSLMLLIFGCDTKQSKRNDNNVKLTKKKNTQTVKVQSLVESVSQSPVSRFGPIEIRFRRAIGKTGEDASSLIRIEPKIKGKIVWSSASTISIKPDKSLGRGKSYKVSVLFSKWKKLLTKAEDHTFKLITKEQAVDVKMDGLVFKDDSNTQQLSGSLSFVDKEDNKKVESLLIAKHKNKTLKIEWNHGLEGLEHKFTILGIERSKELSEVEVSWDLKKIGINKKDKAVVEVKPYKEFLVEHVKSIFGGAKHVKIIFNDPLNKDQNLNGLIQVDKGEPNFKISGSIVEIYFNKKIPVSFEVKVNPGIENKHGHKLKKQSTHKISMPNLRPGVRFIGKGNILPDGEKITVSFEAVNVDSVQLTAFRVYKKNLSYFLQDNDYEGSYRLKNYGRYLWRKTIDLDVKKDQVDNWSRFNFELSELTKKFPENLIRLELSINRENSLYKCGENEQRIAKEAPFTNKESLELEAEKSSWDFSETYYNQTSNNSDYRDKNDPCKDVYYTSKYYKSGDVTSHLNILKTNIGIIAKKDDNNNLLVVATEIDKGTPLAEAKVDILNFQGHVLEQLETDDNGFAGIQLDEIPFLVRVSKNGDTSYLKINVKNSLSNTHFDVGGDIAKNGLKGFIYGERGVWRPGDDIHLVLALHDPMKKIPAGFPIRMTLKDPNGEIFATEEPVKSLGGFYYFKFKTQEESITGKWKASGLVGPRVFHKTLNIETVVPNRLKVNLDFANIEKEKLGKGTRDVTIFSQWLHGAKAAGLKTSVTVNYTKAKTSFNKYSDYEFDDIAANFSSYEEEIFNGKLDSKGEKKTKFKFDVSDGAPGKLTATFKTKVFEQGGAYSTETVDYPFYPYKSYIGIKTPKGDVARGMLLTDVDHELKIVNVSVDGDETGNNEVGVNLYKISWKWWWDKKEESFAHFSRSRSTRSVASGTVKLTSGVGSWKFKVKYPSWGRYLLRACDKVNKHCSSKIVYIDWPGWAGRAQKDSGGNASRLNITTDKAKYNIGETAKLFIPKTIKGKALISIEGSSKLLNHFWVDLKGEEKQVDIKITEGMAPNIYVNVSLIQPHSGKQTDTPLRLYGIASILVNDPATNLEPLLETPEQLAPLKDFKVTVSEANGKAMTYTLAMVDEGLLGLTRFTSANLHKKFYQKGSLGVMTWDLYDQVIGAYNAKLESLIAIGGDEGLSLDKNKGKKRRFPPVVQFLGPQTLKPGEKKEISLKMPNYIGAVRLMLIAGEQEAYGNVSKSLQVKEDLMILPTLPRILGPEDSFEMPITVFASKDELGSVAINAEASSGISFPKGAEVDMSFQKQGQKMTYIPLKVGEQPGDVSLSVYASAGNVKAKKEVNLKIRQPNPMLTKVKTAEIGKDEVIELNYSTHGVNGTNSASLEISKVLPLNLGKRLNYLIRYPHGCIEQTTSGAFPQLFLPEVIELTDDEKNKISSNIEAAINRLSSFQVPSGGLGYWPSRNEADEWGTNYAGYFLIMAQKKGFSIPSDLLEGILNYQKEKANKWNPSNSRAIQSQVFRLLFLAEAQNANVGAMNLVRKSTMPLMSKWQLAHALSISGFKEQAEELVESIGFEVDEYVESTNTYGSRIRDLGVILAAMTNLGSEQSKEVYDIIAKQLSDNKKRFNTQGLAYALIGTSEFLINTQAKEEVKFEFESNGETKIKSFENSMTKIKLENILNGNNKLKLKNLSKSKLFFTRSVVGSPAIGEEEDYSKKLGLKINYLDYSDQSKGVNVKTIKRGTQFVARVVVSNKTKKKVENIALEYILASGWDVMNANLNNDNENNFDYQDVRDDRIYTYFSILPNEKKIFEFVLQGSLAGKFYLPATKVEAMYEYKYSAQKKGQWVEVVN